jgi:hypothetical protein
MISLAIEDGARKDLLRYCTHGPPRREGIDAYVTIGWAALCAEVLKFKIERPPQGGLVALAVGLIASAEFERRVHDGPVEPRKGLLALEAGIGSLKSVPASLRELGDRLARLDAQMAAVDAKLQTADGRTAALGTRAEGIEKSGVLTAARLGEIEATLKRVAVRAERPCPACPGAAANVRADDGAARRDSPGPAGPRPPAAP